jgi:hypothetical protein
MTVLRWEEPPRSGALAWAAKWQDVTDELRALPNTWAAIEEAEKPTNLVSRIRKGEGPFGPASHFEALSRTRPRTPKQPPAVIVYARYIGPGPVVEQTGGGS